MENETINIDLYHGKSKKTGKPFTCLKLNIGKWNTLVFPRSIFELDYIKQILEKNK